MTRRWSGLFLLFVAASALGIWYWNYSRPENQMRRHLTAALAARLAGDNADAEQLAASVLELKPDSVQAGLIAAESAAAEGRKSDAIAWAEPFLGSADAGTRLQFSLLVIPWGEEIQQLDLLESAYLEVLEHEPNDLDVLDSLARLYASTTRRARAIPFILRLLQLNEPTDLVYMLARQSAVLGDPVTLQRAVELNSQQHAAQIGLAWHAARDQRVDESVRILNDVIQSTDAGPIRVDAMLALGKHLLEQERWDELLRWNESLPRAAEQFAECWRIRGRMAEQNQQVDAAIGCYLRAIQLAPESRKVTGRVAQLLASRDAALAKKVRLYWEQTVELETLQQRFNNSPDSWNAFFALARGYQRLGRDWEAWGWMMLHGGRFQQHAEYSEMLDEFRISLPQRKLRQTQPDKNPALGVDLNRWPSPTFPKSFSTDDQIAEDSSTIQLQFAQIGAESGLDFRYVNGASFRHLMHEFAGGGIGCIDFDLDGFTDLYFTQGQNSVPLSGSPGEMSDQLFRNKRGQSFVAVPGAVVPGGFGFGQGVSIGDVNSDGFPDVYVANIGVNELFLNCGDGTFEKSESAPGPADAWTSSVAIADLNGDTLPDIYCVNYAGGDDIFERVCAADNQTPRMCIHTDFDSQADQIWLNSGDGEFFDATTELLGAAPKSYGWGVVVWKDPASPPHRMSVFVSNDLRSNYLYRPIPAGGLRDDAFAAAVAMNEDGKPEGCMGIAAYANNVAGHPSFFVTNFYQESNTLYSWLQSGLYQDVTRRQRLHKSSFDKLGFGCQFADFNLDGQPELIVANGHIDDLRPLGKPWKMRPQMYSFNGRHFQEVSGVESTGYFDQKWIARAVAVTDWNRDARPDVVMGHLFDHSRLLTNQTPPNGHAVTLKCIGRDSNRDALGTIVRLRHVESERSYPVFGGSGFQASNDRRQVIPCGRADRVDLEIEWPSGKTEMLESLPVGTHYTVVEGSGVFKQATGFRDE